MKRPDLFIMLMIPLLVAAAVSLPGCGGCQPNRPQSVSGVSMATVGKLETDEKGQTVEQRNIIERLKRDNDLGAIKHLYVISAYSGQVILYSPVKGKVTSGGKYLTPKDIVGGPNNNLPSMQVASSSYYVNRLPNEDGTFGSGSPDYIYWFTPGDGAYHQHFLGGGQIVHISDNPIAVKSVIMTIESGKK
jgi:hypothetical protein